MKESKKTKLSLTKVTVWNFGIVLGSDEQKRVKGGTAAESGKTEIIIFC